MHSALQYILLLLLSLCYLDSSIAASDTRLLVETTSKTLSVVQNGKIRLTFNDIAIGRGGLTDTRALGDGKTPRGIFKIAWINSNSRYHLFFGFSYPTIAMAERALANSDIDRPTYHSIVNAVNNGKVPPQNTALGGYLGIHGLGKASKRVHRSFNWTQGCIALTDEQIDQLAQWVSIGTQVVIR